MSFLGASRKSQALVKSAVRSRVSVVGSAESALDDAIAVEAGGVAHAMTPHGRELRLYRLKGKKWGKAEGDYVMVDADFGDYQQLDARLYDVDHVAKAWARFIKRKSIDWTAML